VASAQVSRPQDGNRRLFMRVGIITSYPEDGVRKSGIAEYSRALIEPLGEVPDDITIFADHRPGTSFFAKNTVERLAANMLLIRCWRFGALAPFMLYRTLRRANLDALHIEYDVYLYGGVIAALILPLLLKLLAIRRKTLITTTLHGVVPLSAISREMLRENGFVLPFSRIGKAGFRLIYWLFRFSSDRFIALEAELSNVLCEDYGYPRPHTFTVECPNLMEERKASDLARNVSPPVRKKKRLLYFGYASSYKGLSILLEAFRIARRKDPEIELNLVAGRHPRLAGQPKYEAFYGALRELAAEVGAKHYDFLKERDLAQLLADSDAVILPYTKMYGASGPLNIAIAARKPVLVSRVVYFHGARPGQVFEPTAESCAAAILRFFSGMRFEIENDLEALAASRDNRKIAAINHRIRCGADPITLPSMASVRDSDRVMRA